MSKLPEMQIGFIDSICAPIYSAFAKLFPRELSPLLEGCLANRDLWADLAQQRTNELAISSGNSASTTTTNDKLLHQHQHQQPQPQPQLIAPDLPLISYLNNNNHHNIDRNNGNTSSDEVGATTKKANKSEPALVSIMPKGLGQTTRSSPEVSGLSFAGAARPAGPFGANSLPNDTKNHHRHHHQKLLQLELELELELGQQHQHQSQRQRQHCNPDEPNPSEQHNREKDIPPLASPECICDTDQASNRDSSCSLNNTSELTNSETRPISATNASDAAAYNNCCEHQFSNNDCQRKSV